MSSGNLLPGAYQATGFRAAEVIRRSGRALPAEGSADRHLRYDRELMAREAERLFRNNWLYSTLVTRSEELVLGREGFRLRVLTPDEDLNRRIEADFRAWARRPEVTGRHSWRACEGIAFRSWMNRGDLGIVRLATQQIQYIEAGRITGGRRAARASRNGGRVEQGVELDSLDRTLAYWVAPYDKDGQVRAAKAKRVSARDMILFANRKRFGQVRGVPELVPIFPLIHRIDDILDSEAIAWQQLARLTVIMQLEGGPAAAKALSNPTGDTAPGTYEPPDLSERWVDIEQGTTIWAKPGEEVKAVPRDLPGANFPQSVRTMIQLASTQGGIPLSVLLLDAKGINYTGSRHELEQAYRTVVRRQLMLREEHHDPVTQWFLEWGIESGRYPEEAFGEFYRWEWDAPRFPWVDQLAETKAWGARLDRGFGSLALAHQSLGIDSDDWVERRRAEIKRARGVVASIRAEEIATGDERLAELGPIPWQHFAGLEFGKTAQAKATETNEEGLEPTDQDGGARPRPGS